MPTEARADVKMDLDVLGSLYMGAHRASTFVGANRLRSNDSGLTQRIDAAFISDVPAKLGYGF
jgi:predicted acetyltransferase